MQKTLRSLIHEKIPEELRFQLELLSRKRNLINEEKHGKIIELFREFDIKGVVQLGPGTNRYAIKIDGYVLKIATDNDGKIDNLKEFKMAKRLYPYVTKTYEVSENGTLLVAEYISPFSSYHEMTMYADQIREILTKLSNTYLIGDVGITSKNFANWGLRAGSSEPVCLDFAYVYEVSSELFICRKCNTNSMLVPDRDFKRLHCSNPTCGQEYSFEDIRSKIGNDIHRHEIGDLKEEGYYLTSSNVKTELSEQRSNYLARKKTKNNNHEHSKKLETITEEDITMSKNIENNMAIATAMAANNTGIPTIKATTIVPKDDIPGNVIKAKAVPYSSSDVKNVIKATAVVPVKSKSVEEATDEDLAFIGSIDSSVNQEHDNTPKNDSAPDTLYVHDVANGGATKAIVIQTPSAQEKVEEDRESTVPEIPSKVWQPRSCINDWFINNMERAFSKISNRISNVLHIQNIFDEVRNDLRGKQYPEEFYKTVQNAVFRSLVEFCNFTVKDVPNAKGNGTHKEFTPPTDILGTAYEDTMIFMSRVWNNREVNTTEDPDLMDSYCKIYDDYFGIQREWLDFLERRIKNKMQIPKSAIDKIIEAIALEWCVADEDEDEHHDDQIEETAESVEVEVSSDDEDTDEEFMTAAEAAEAAMLSESPTNEDEEVAFSGTMDVDVIQDPNGDSDNEDEYDEDDEEEPEYLSVEIYHEDDYDIVRVNTAEFFGPVNIPFYCVLDDVDGDSYNPSIADDRNGVWDWLIHMVPDLMFTTSDPTKWLEINNVELDINQPHVVIMDEDRGEYTMGVYYLKGIFDIDEDGNMVAVFDEELLKKINKLIRDDIGYGRISHLRRSLNMSDLIYDEEYIMERLTGIVCDDDDEVIDNAAEQAAIEAMNMEDYEIPADEKAEEVVEESKDEEPEEVSDVPPTTFKPIRRNS